ncbi:hypothetical protein GCM10022220_72970 [Actinocatenispora rupis]|uniref:Uncharacterized protein n=1 Tax=Actinocatenispora rupis TaxID=519421 RepID=A0A8J3JK42_9ACTN|nr:hypothetical protein Aru02nite_72720 [Actinocatenispora rupis]
MPAEVWCTDTGPAVPVFPGDALPAECEPPDVPAIPHPASANGNAASTAALRQDLIIILTRFRYLPTGTQRGAGSFRATS